ncbi:MAG: nicotinate-nicotinamide nucleotide adenylyltransferase [Vampirovibrio sp.]|nr:nicotinate-nicotinamide nucleotide adenylyltransferase [Vampirovibrio sp.]
MAVLLYFGSFNPVHNAHLTMAIEAQKAGGFEKVLFVPALAPPNKSGQKGLWDFDIRLSLLKLALQEANNPALAISTIEQTIGSNKHQPLYTAKVLEGLFHAPLEELEAGSVDVLMGADTFASLPAWHRWEDIVRVCRFWVVPRPDQQLAIKTLPWVGERGVAVRLVPMVAMVVSATDVRAAMRVGDWDFVSGCVPFGVLGALRRLPISVVDRLHG